MNKQNIEMEEISLSQETTIFEQAKTIAKNNIKGEKFPFELIYNKEEKEFLLNILELSGCTLKKEYDETDSLVVYISMEQLEFVKSLNCIKEVKEYETKLKTTDNILTRKENFGNINTEQIDDSDFETKQSSSVMAVLETTDNEPTTYSVASTYSTTAHSINTTMETAKEIRVGYSTSGCICCPCTAEWYRFQVDDTGVYTIHTSGNLDTIGYLYDSTGNQIACNDDHNGKTYFKIQANLTAGQTYYVKVKAYGSNVGGYYIRVANEIWVTSVMVSPTTATIAVGETLQLSATVLPSNATIKDVRYITYDEDIVTVDSSGLVTALGTGTAIVYVYDRNNRARMVSSTIKVEMPYCGGDNYEDVTKHTLALQEDGYYRCTKCGYKFKSPALQDYEIMGKTDDYLKVTALAHFMSQAQLMSQRYPESKYFYDDIVSKSRITIDTIRSKSEYATKYEYKDSTGKYYCTQTNDTFVEFVPKSKINWVTISSYNGFYESICSLVISYYCPPVGKMIDIINLVTGRMNALDFGELVADYLDDSETAELLQIASIVLGFVESDVKIGDNVVNISFNAYSHAEYIFDENKKIKSVRIHFGV